jgi:hypothetical protein
MSWNLSTGRKGLIFGLRLSFHSKVRYPFSILKVLLRIVPNVVPLLHERLKRGYVTKLRCIAQCGEEGWKMTGRCAEGWTAKLALFICWWCTRVRNSSVYFIWGTSWILLLTFAITRFVRHRNFWRKHSVSVINWFVMTCGRPPGYYALIF